MFHLLAREIFIQLWIKSLFMIKLFIFRAQRPHLKRMLIHLLL